MMVQAERHAVLARTSFLGLRFVALAGFLSLVQGCSQSEKASRATTSGMPAVRSSALIAGSATSRDDGGIRPPVRWEPPCMTYSDLSARQGPYGVRAVIDTTTRKLLVVNSTNYQGMFPGEEYKPALSRCNLDGTRCTYSDISAGQRAGSGWTPSAVVDATNRKL